MDEIKLIIVDDHEVVRTGINQLFNREKEMKVLASVSSGGEAMKLIKELNPDVVITDISMPVMSGIELSKLIRDNYPDTSVLILSMHKEEEYVMEAFNSGALGYISKDSGRTEIIRAVNFVANNKMYYERSFFDFFAKKIISNEEVKEIKKNISLTKRELEVLNLIVKGFSNKEIAEKLFLSKRTIDAHRTNLMGKMAAKNTADIVRTAFTKGFIDLK